MFLLKKGNEVSLSCCNLSKATQFRAQWELGLKKLIFLSAHQRAWHVENAL